MKEIYGYQISCGGIVINVKGKEMTPQLHGNGYYFLRLWKNGKAKAFDIHRLVALAFIPNPLNLPEVNHLDGNKTNNFAWNLEWCTRSENMKHRFKIGLMNHIGINNSNVKLTEQQVEEIRQKYIPQIYPLRKLAREYGVSHVEISHIIHGTTWINL